jgi:hypothetical protein
MFEVRTSNGEKVDPPLCDVCAQHLNLLNNGTLLKQLEPLVGHNLETHMHFSHGVGYYLAKEA